MAIHTVEPGSDGAGHYQDMPLSLSGPPVAWTLRQNYTWDP
jgi:hypothetical protein